MSVRNRFWTAALCLGFSGGWSACATTADTSPAPVIAAAVADSARPDADRSRDSDRLPAQLIALTGMRPGSKVAEIYGGTEISERHRHRYEVNTAYKDRLEKHGLKFSGLSPDGVLPEIVEYENHPWFIGVQYHPELKSRPFEPHPLFASFIKAAAAQSRLV